MNVNVAVIDLETTGKVSGTHEIIEIGIIYCRLEEGKLVKQDSFHSLIKPYHLKRIDEEALKINGITLEQLEQAPRATEVRSNLESWWSNCVSCQCIHAGHNPGFDKGFLIGFLGLDTYNSFFEYWTLDSKSLAWAQQVAGHIPEDESLSLLPLMEYFDIYSQPHSALGDSWASLEVMNKLVGNQ